MRTFQQKFAYTAMTAALLAGLSACGGDNNEPPKAEEAAVDTSFDPYYNVCRGTDSKCYNEWGAFASTPNRVLIYSRTAGPRHANLGTPMAAGLNPVMNADNVMQAGLKRMMEEAGIQADWTEDVTVLAGRINNSRA